jgi:prophage regulatory protein
MLKARANMRLKTLHGAETTPSRATRELQRRPPTPEPTVRPANLQLLAGTATPTDALVQVRFLRLPEVKAITGLGKTSIYEQIRDKSFPAPVRLGLRAVGWVESEVRQWAQERVHESRPAA